MQRDFFSLGGVFSRWWPSRAPGVAPWICASALLTSGAVWDWVRTGGEVDFILLGLAAYELVIGLTEESVPAPAAGRSRELHP